jgi:hypothetical protein
MHVVCGNHFYADFPCDLAKRIHYDYGSAKQRDEAVSRDTINDYHQLLERHFLHLHVTYDDDVKLNEIDDFDQFVKNREYRSAVINMHHDDGSHHG